MLHSGLFLLSLHCCLCVCNWPFLCLLVLEYIYYKNFICIDVYNWLLSTLEIDTIFSLPLSKLQIQNFKYSSVFLETILLSKLFFCLHPSQYSPIE